MKWFKIFLMISGFVALLVVLGVWDLTVDFVKSFLTTIASHVN